MSAHTVVPFSPRAARGDGDGRPAVEAPHLHPHEHGRVQLRLPLATVEQVGQDLDMLLQTVLQAQQLVRARHKNPATLAAVRLLFTRLNRYMNRVPPMKP